MGLKKFFKPPKEMTQEESREFLENNGVTVKRDYASDGRRFKFGEFSKYTKDKVSKQEPLRPRGWTPPPDPNDSANDFNSSNNDLNASNIPPYSAPANSNTGNSSDPYSSGNGNVYETQTSNSDPYSYGNDPYQQRPQSLQQRQNSYNRNGSANDSRFGSTSRKNSAMNGVGVGAVAGSVAGASAASFASRRQNSSSNGQQQQNSYDPYTQTASSGTGSKNSDDPYAADPYSNNNDPYANYDPYSGNNDPYSSTGGGALSHSMSQLSVNGKQMSNTGSGSFQQQQLMDQNETALQQQEQQQQQQRSNDDDLDLNNYPGEYQNNTYQSYGEQEYDPYSQQEQEQVQEVDSEEEEVNRIIRQSKETREATVQSSQNILSHLRQADETATNTIGVLGSQREKMFQIERDLNTMGSQQRFVGEHVKDLEHYNRGLFHVKVSNPFTKKARRKQAEDLVTLRRQQDRDRDSALNAELSKVQNGLIGELKNNGEDPENQLLTKSDLRAKYEYERRVKEATQYLTSDHDEYDEKNEVEISENVDEAHRLAGMLRKKANVISGEIDSQNHKLRKMAEKVDKVDDTLVAHTNRLRGI
ncbi:hypothetical protein BVG19_g1993 [[Candida] boidinii]|nr:hypothetical protein BVG19_g1993 [[Candida] boidinii]OWB49406.1 hypothetical protein B5S27_g947 [[Candida] boidinii]